MRHRTILLAGLVGLIAFVTGLGTPAAEAAQLSGGGLAGGQQVVASISAAGDTLAYSFAATAHQHVDFDVTASTWDTGEGATLSWYRPGGSLLGQCLVGVAAKACDTTADVTGTWTFLIEPADSGTGQLTFTYLTDQDLGTLSAATAVTTTFGTPGQNAIYRFAGTSGQRVLFDITAFGLGRDGTARLTFTEPDGSAGDYCVLATAPDSCTVTPDATGTWTVSLDPTGAEIGAVTFVYGPDQVGGGLLPGKSVTATISTANQVATYTFAATAHRPISFPVTSASWISPAPAYLYFFAPGSDTLFSHCTAAVDADCKLTPPRSGTWHLTVSASGSTGRTTFGFLPDQAKGYLIKGKPKTTNIITPGLNAMYTFPATKGKKTRFTVTSTGWTKGSVVRLYVFPPAGSPLFDFCSVTKKTTCTTIPNATGTWRLELDPQAEAVGHITFVRR